MVDKQDELRPLCFFAFYCFSFCTLQSQALWISPRMYPRAQSRPAIWYPGSRLVSPSIVGTWSGLIGPRKPTSLYARIAATQSISPSSCHVSWKSLPGVLHITFRKCTNFMNGPHFFIAEGISSPPLAKVPIVCVEMCHQGELRSAEAVKHINN